MTSKQRLIATTLLLGGLFVAASPAPQAADVQHPAPASALVEHARVLDELADLARRPGPVGAVGERLRDVMRTHLTYREDVVLPSFTLLPRMADETATPDMVWAVALGDRVRRERDQDLLTRLEITDRLIDVFAAAGEAGDETAA